MLRPESSAACNAAVSSVVPSPLAPNISGTAKSAEEAARVRAALAPDGFTVSAERSDGASATGREAPSKPSIVRPSAACRISRSPAFTLPATGAK
jgi:hypothetical protein